MPAVAAASQQLLPPSEYPDEGKHLSSRAMDLQADVALNTSIRRIRELLQQVSGMDLAQELVTGLVGADPQGDLPEDSSWPDL